MPSLDFYSASSLNNSLQVDTSFHLGHIILIQSQPVFALTP